MSHKKRTFGDWLLFPFKVYMLIAPIEWYVWWQLNFGQKIRGVLAESTIPIVLGFLICFLVFLLAAVIRFATRRRELVAENLVMAGLSFIIFCTLAPYAATA